MRLMSRPKRTALLIALFAADIWVALTVVTAVSRGEGEGGVFWAAVVLLILLLVGLVWLTIRAVRALRRDGQPLSL